MNMDLAIFLEFPVRGAVVRLEVIHYSVLHRAEHCKKGGMGRKRRGVGKRREGRRGGRMYLSLCCDRVHNGRGKQRILPISRVWWKSYPQYAESLVMQTRA
jgi:hypothetical protein